MTLGIRSRLLLVVIAAIVVSVAGLVAGFNIVLGRSLDRKSHVMLEFGIRINDLHGAATKDEAGPHEDGIT